MTTPANEVIREVTEPTSPNIVSHTESRQKNSAQEYASESRNAEKGISVNRMNQLQSSSLHKVAAAKKVTEDDMNNDGNKELDKKFELSPSKTDLTKSGAGFSMRTGESHHVLNLEQLEAIK